MIRVLAWIYVDWERPGRGLVKRSHLLRSHRIHEETTYDDIASMNEETAYDDIASMRRRYPCRFISQKTPRLFVKKNELISQPVFLIREGIHTRESP